MRCCHRPAFAAVFSLALLLSACVSPDAPRPLGPDVPPPPQFAELVHRCTANDSRFALGQKVTPEVLEEARNRTGARSAVTVKSGAAMPAPADPLRLILEVDGEGKMVGARCS
ncbi:Peptidase inhibitor I78 family protein [Variovorax sp. OV329]|nr:Peptidase inhibitor I78 family protein [Variovorax sp. OV329]